MIIPDDSLPIIEAVEPFRRNGRRMNMYYNRLMRLFCRDFDIEEGTPLTFEGTAEKLRKILIHGATSKDEATYKAEWEGVLPMLQRRWENTESEFVKSRLHSYQSEQPCEEIARGRRLKPQALAVKVGGKSIRR